MILIIDNYQSLLIIINNYLDLINKLLIIIVSLSPTTNYRLSLQYTVLNLNVHTVFIYL